jgi:hypothetical protein
MLGTAWHSSQLLPRCRGPWRAPARQLRACSSAVSCRNVSERAERSHTRILENAFEGNEMPDVRVETFAGRKVIEIQNFEGSLVTHNRFRLGGARALSSKLVTHHPL